MVENEKLGLRYLRVAQVLRQKIMRGTYKVGERLMSQHDLAREQGVAISTLQRSLEVLEREGYIVRRHGQGTYAALPERQTRRALVVDGDRDARASYEEALLRVGWETIVVATGLAALERLRVGEFDAVFLDLATQGAEGVHTFREIRRIDPVENVVLVATHSDLGLVKEAMSVGTFVLLSKPFGLRSIQVALSAEETSADAEVPERSLPVH